MPTQSSRRIKVTGRGRRRYARGSSASPSERKDGEVMPEEELIGFLGIKIADAQNDDDGDCNAINGNDGDRYATPA